MSRCRTRTMWLDPDTKIRFADHTVIAAVNGTHIRITHRHQIEHLYQLHPDWDGTIHILPKPAPGQPSADTLISAGRAATWNVDPRTIHGRLPSDPRNHLLTRLARPATDPAGTADQLARTLFASRWNGPVPANKLDAWRTALRPYTTGQPGRAAQLALIAAAWEATPGHIRRNFPLNKLLDDIAAQPAIPAPPSNIDALVAAFCALGVPSLQRDQLRNLLYELCITPPVGTEHPGHNARRRDPAEHDLHAVSVAIHSAATGDAELAEWIDHASPQAGAVALRHYLKAGGNLNQFQDYEFVRTLPAFALIFDHCLTTGETGPPTKALAEFLAGTPFDYMARSTTLRALYEHAPMWLAALLETKNTTWLTDAIGLGPMLAGALDDNDPANWSTITRLWDRIAALHENGGADVDVDIDDMAARYLTLHTPECAAAVIAHVDQARGNPWLARIGDRYGARRPAATLNIEARYAGVRGPALLNAWKTDGYIPEDPDELLREALDPVNNVNSDDLERIVGCLPVDVVAAHLEKDPSFIRHVPNIAEFLRDTTAAAPDLTHLYYRTFVKGNLTAAGYEDLYRETVARLPAKPRKLVISRLLETGNCPATVIKMHAEQQAAEGVLYRDALSRLPDGPEFVADLLRRHPELPYQPEEPRSTHYFTVAAKVIAAFDDDTFTRRGRQAVEAALGVIDRNFARTEPEATEARRLLSDAFARLPERDRIDLLRARPQRGGSAWGIAPPEAVPDHVYHELLQTGPAELRGLVLRWAISQRKPEAGDTLRSLLAAYNNARTAAELDELDMILAGPLHAAPHLHSPLLTDDDWFNLVARAERTTPGLHGAAIVSLLAFVTSDVPYRDALQWMHEGWHSQIVEYGIRTGIVPAAPVHIPDPAVALRAIESGWRVTTNEPHAKDLTAAARTMASLSNPRPPRNARDIRYLATYDPFPEHPGITETLSGTAITLPDTAHGNSPENSRPGGGTYDVKVLANSADLAVNAAVMRNCTWSVYRPLLAAGRGIMLAIGRQPEPGRRWECTWNAWIEQTANGWKIGEVNSVANSGNVPPALVIELQRRVDQFHAQHPAGR